MLPSLLPAELVWKISQFCGIREQLKMKLTCCQWNSVVEIDFGQPNGDRTRALLCRAVEPKIYNPRTRRAVTSDVTSRKNEARRNVYVAAAGEGNLRFVDYFLTLDSICINPAIFWTGLLAAGSNGQIEVAKRILRRASTFTWSLTLTLTEEEEFKSVGSAYLFDAMSNAAITGQVHFIKAFISNRELIGDGQLLTLFLHAQTRERFNYQQNVPEIPLIMSQEIKRRKL